MDGKTYDGELDVYVSSMHAGEKPPCIICQTIRAIFIVQNLIICRVLYVSSERRLRWWSQLFVPYANPLRVRKVKPLKDTKIHERLSLRGLICLTKE